MIRMPPGHPTVEVFWVHPTDRRPRGRHKTRWRDRGGVARWSDVWNALLYLLPPCLTPD